MILGLAKGCNDSFFKYRVGKWKLLTGYFLHVDATCLRVVASSVATELLPLLVPLCSEPLPKSYVPT